MITDITEKLVTWTITGLELAALLTVGGGFVWSITKSVLAYLRNASIDYYPSFRRELGRSTLVALELLVAADILRSLVLEPSLTNVGVLAALVTIRTFLSFSIDVELDGCWPWERAASKKELTCL
ncbi:DUF1622 domain-containing protein [uncultured Brevundimonas sp.]|jgi:uncharacterized membrane protein|uniref:DUF1622 domain-containing protein n=1 Tax=uncultured Brevundimonas sp. TaxID=213418 RepID=UPI0030EC25EC|tara:strand:+ start:1657 stop:2031 length:375 start_codon:yes stop_codon:yes gene_type:complete